MSDKPAPESNFERVEPTDVGLNRASDILAGDDEAFMQTALGLKPKAPTTPVASPESALPAPSASEPPTQVEAPQPDPQAQAPQVEGEAESTAAPAEEPAPPAEPEPEPQPLLTKFELADEVGPLDVHDAAKRLKVSLKANGKDYKDLPLDKVVLLAQMGFANQEREAQVLAAKKFVADAETEKAELRAAVAEYEARTRRILEDYNEYEAARERYARANSPEARAARAEAEAQALRAQTVEAQTNAVRQQYVSQVLYPTLRQAIDSTAGAVSEEAVLGQFSMLTAPLMVRGQLPVERFGEAQHLVETQLLPWIRNQAVLRETEKQREAAESKSKLDKAAQAAALAKRSLARAAAPSAASSAPVPVGNKAKTYKSAQDWMTDMGGLLSTQEPS